MKYSDKESWMFRALNMEYLTYLNISPISAYRIAVDNVFINKFDENEAVKSLRRTYGAMVNAQMYRMTKEFDDLITC